MLGNGDRYVVKSKLMSQAVRVARETLEKESKIESQQNRKQAK